MLVSTFIATLFLLFTSKDIVITSHAQEFECPSGMQCVVRCSANPANGCYCDCSTPAPGNISTCWNGAVNCATGATIALQQPVDTFCSAKWGYTKGMCRPLGSAQQISGCCGQIQTDDETGEEYCTNDEITTYNCCGAGTVNRCSFTGGTYTKVNSCFGSQTICDPGDRYESHISNTPAAGLCIVDCAYNDDGDCIKGSQFNVYKTLTTCTKRICACVSTCAATAPTTASNPTPANGSTVATTTVPLSWSQPTSWGAGCPSNNNRYLIYIGADNSASMTHVQTVSANSTSFNGISGKTYYWSVYPNNGSLSATSATVWSFTINVPPAITTPWWQVKDGDVTAANGGITSQVPATKYFNLDGTGTFPGVPVYSGGLSYTPGLLSSKNWSANTGTTQGRIFDYTYFKNLIPDNVVPTSIITSPGFSADGYEWYKVNGSLTLNTTNFGTRKVILFVENGNLTINGNINVDDGVGFFGAFVDGNINVASTVTGAAALEGIYLSDGSFTTDLAASQLHIRGSVASFGGVSLQRNLVDDSIASELFEYAPDQILLFPKKLGYRRTKWSEIAP